MPTVAYEANIHSAKQTETEASAKLSSIPENIDITAPAPSKEQKTLGRKRIRL